MNAAEVSSSAALRSGSFYILSATVFQAALDSVAKGLGGIFPVSELVCARYTVHVVLALAIFGPTMRGSLFRTGSLRLQMLRSLTLLMTTVLYFLSLRFLPLAETTAITFASPLITVAMSGPLLGERRGRASIGAVVLGFLGVVAVIQPFSGQFGVAALLPLGAACSSSAYAMLTRFMGRRDPAPVTWFYSGLVGMTVAAFGAPFGWIAPPSNIDLLLVVLLGVFGGAGHFLLIKAYQRAAASVLAPLAYIELIWITLIGLVIFHELPNVVGLVGILLISVGGIIAAIRPGAGEARPPEAAYPPPQ